MSQQRRKMRVGRVVSDKTDKTVVVAVEWRQRHPLYGKSVRRVTKFQVHDQDNTCHTGDSVRIVETRPLSRTKRWRVVEVLARGEVPEVKPGDIELEEVVRAVSPQEEATVATASTQPAEALIAESAQKADAETETEGSEG